MIVATALLTAIAALLSEAEDVRPAMRAIGLGTRTWEPRHRVFFIRFSEDEPHWRTPKKRLTLPDELGPQFRDLIERLVDHLGGRVPLGVRLSPSGWTEFSNDWQPSEADPGAVELFLERAGLEARVSDRDDFLTIEGDGWVLRVEGWCESCVSEGFGPWSTNPRWRTPDPDASWPSTDEGEDFLAHCVAESKLRIDTIAEGKSDGPPEDATEWVLDLWIGASDPRETYDVVQIQLWRTGKWGRTKDGRLVGYRVMRYDPVRHEAVSGADSRQRVPLVSGETHTMTGRGFFLTNSAQHALDYYAGHDWNVLMVYAFDPADHTGGDIHGRDTEISVRKGELLEWQLHDENGDVWTGGMPPVEPIVEWKIGETVEVKGPGYHAFGKVTTVRELGPYLMSWVEVLPRRSRDLGFDPTDRVFWLDSVEVEESLRGKGVGTKLVQLLEGRARNAGCKGVVLHAGDLGGGGGHSRPFWLERGYSDVPGSKPRGSDDTLMVKHFS